MIAGKGALFFRLFSYFSENEAKLLNYLYWETYGYSTVLQINAGAGICLE